VNLDADEEIRLTFPCEVALEGLYLRGVSSGVIKILTKSLSNSEESLAKLWQPLDTALSAMSGGKPVFGKLKEVEFILPASTIWATEIHQLMTGQGELLPSVEAQGAMVLVRMERDGEKEGLLDRLHQM